MSARVFVGGQRVDAIAADDRGLAYGDGLFETMRVQRGDAPWWDAHWSRLALGAERLRLSLPDQAMCRAEAGEMLEGVAAGVLKLIVTRGSGGRGYVPAGSNAPAWILSTHPLPPAPRVGGLALRWCATRLSVQPTLAGIKHCNRLEQVLARAEWNAAEACDRDADEGLMLDMDDNVVCATAANLFVRSSGRWITPRVDRCGVAGVCRAWVLSALTADESRLSRQQVEAAEAVFLCNAVRGILPVARLGERAWALHPQVSVLRDRLAAAAPMFATND
jgi:4-amino-4-deoxychorismate lyase